MGSLAQRRRAGETKSEEEGNPTPAIGSPATLSHRLVVVDTTLRLSSVEEVGLPRALLPSLTCCVRGTEAVAARFIFQRRS